MSPALAHECPDTPRLALPCKPRVKAGLYMPRGLSVVRSPLPRASDGPAITMASCALPSANLQELPEDYSGWYRGLSPFSHAIRLRIKRGAPEHRDS